MATRKGARALFEESLADQGLTRGDISPVVFSYPLIERYRVMVQFLRRQWQEAFDIPILLEGSEWGAYLDRIRKGQYQAGTVLWYSWINDPTYNLMTYWKRHTFCNMCQWEDPHYIRQIDEAEQAPKMGETWQRVRGRVLYSRSRSLIRG